MNRREFLKKLGLLSFVAGGVALAGLKSGCLVYEDYGDYGDYIDYGDYGDYGDYCDYYDYCDSAYEDGYCDYFDYCDHPG